MKHRYLKQLAPADHPLRLSALRLSAPAGELPPSVDLRQFCKPVRDQGQEGACSGFAEGAFVETMLGAVGRPVQDYLSPAYIYAKARMAEGTFPQDSGAMLADGMGCLQAYGICLEADLPYSANPAEAPTPKAEQDAIAFRVGLPCQVDWSDARNVKAVLAASRPVAIGFSVYESFEEFTGNDGKVVLAENEGEFLGGHAVLVVGYDAFGWIVRNSWGAGWGADGYCFMPYGYEARYWNEAWTASPG